MARADLKPAEEMEWTGALNQKVHGFLLKPRNFDATKRYPLARPDSRRAAGRLERQHGAIAGIRRSLRDAGYVVFMPNPRGSTGYGQQFTNEISGDWGGKVLHRSQKWCC